jgi:hypothetical protein
METIHYDINNAIEKGPINIVIYGVDSIIQPYIYFLCKKKNTIQFEQTEHVEHFKKDYEYKGNIYFEDENYAIFEDKQIESEFLPITDDNKLWKVLSFEILYSKKVMNVDVDKKVVNFFRHYPNMLIYALNGYKLESPVVGYVGIGEDELNEQIILQKQNNKDGVFKRGYYFLDYESALHEANHEKENDEYLLKLKNISITDSLIDDLNITIRDDKFFINNIFIGDVPPHCNKEAKYTLYYYDKDVVYLKSNKPNSCVVNNKKRDGIVIRYAMFLNRHWIGPKSRKNYDSFSYNSIYMIKSTENFACISYDLYKKII